MYGTQARSDRNADALWFENDVKMYGTQAFPATSGISILFENDVKMYGTQATIAPPSPKSSLRMM